LTKKTSLLIGYTLLAFECYRKFAVLCCRSKLVKFRHSHARNNPDMFTLSIQKEIAAAHRLRNYDGPCARIHGHNWKIRVEVCAEKLDHAGIAIDFSDIETLLWQIIGPFDHQNFNDIAPFDKINPTAENISRFVYQKMKQLLPDGILIKNVQLWETDTYRVTYEE